MLGEEYDDFPFWEKVASDLIRNGVDGLNVHSSIPREPTFPLAIVTQIPAVPVEEHSMDRAEINVQVYANTKNEAREMAKLARVALLQGENRKIDEGTDEDDKVWHESAFLAKVVTSTNIGWNPDPETNKDGYVLGVTISGHSR